MRGRKPELKAIDGGLTKAPAAPAWMPKEAKAEWRRIMPGLAERRVLTEEDMATVEHYCLAVGQVRQCQAALAAASDMFVQSEQSAPRPHPAFRTMHAAMTQARQLAGELGLTPVARQRAGGTGGDDGDGDDFAGLIDG